MKLALVLLLVVCFNAITVLSTFTIQLGKDTDNYSTFYEEDGEPAAIAHATSSRIINSQTNNLFQLQATILNCADGQNEILSFNVRSKVTSTYNAISCQLTLTGMDTVTDYLYYIRSIYYDNFSQAPDTTTRMIMVVAKDSLGNESSASNTTIAIVAINDAPMVDLNAFEIGTAYDTSYNFDSAVSIASTSATITDVDSVAITELRVISKSKCYAEFGEVLFVKPFIVEPSLSMHFNSSSCAFTIVGSAPVSSYETALRNILFQMNNTMKFAERPTVLAFDVVVKDESLYSMPALSRINLVYQDFIFLDINGNLASTNYSTTFAGINRLTKLAANDSTLVSSLTNVNDLTVTIISPSQDKLHDSESLYIPPSKLLATTSATYHTKNRQYVVSGEASVGYYLSLVKEISYFSAAEITEERVVQFVVSSNSHISNFAFSTIYKL